MGREMKKVAKRKDPQDLLPVRNLQLFVAVIETGSMTVAARMLNLTQPAVSMAIGELEQMLNRTLLDRTYRPLRPTTAGRMLLEKSRKVLAELDGLRSAVETSGSMMLPSLNVGLISSATSAGAIAIEEMQGLAKELRVSSSGLTPELSAALRSGTIDILVSTDPMSELTGVDRHLIVREPLVVVYPRSLAFESPVDLERLSSRLPMVHYTARSRLGVMIDQFMRHRGLKVSRRLEFDSSAFFFPLVAEGIGWALTTPLCIVESRVDPSEICIAPLGTDAPYRELYSLASNSDLADVAAKIAVIFSKHIRTRLPMKFRHPHEWILDMVRFPD